MIYLSRLRLNPRSRQVQAEMRDPYQMHRTLSRAFGEEGQYRQARCLFRIEEECFYALVQSRLQPDWEPIFAIPGYLLDRPEVKEIAPRLLHGQRLAFRLRANPTVKRDGKRLPIWQCRDVDKTEQLREAWLRRKGEEHGFRIECTVIRSEPVQSSRTAKGQQTTFNAVRFDGVLRVDDPDRLRAALEGGIGSAKAFGFGLLSLARL